MTTSRGVGNESFGYSRIKEITSKDVSFHGHFISVSQLGTGKQGGDKVFGWQDLLEHVMRARYGNLHALLRDHISEERERGMLKRASGLTCAAGRIPAHRAQQRAG